MSDWCTGMRFNPSRDNVESVVDEDMHTELRAKMAAGVRTSVPLTSS